MVVIVTDSIFVLMQTYLFFRQESVNVFIPQIASLWKINGNGNRNFRRKRLTRRRQVFLGGKQRWNENILKADELVKVRTDGVCGDRGEGRVE